MSHDVFISHASEDAKTAEEIRKVLEADGVRCWIAPRDIAPSMDFLDALLEAIPRSRLVLLIFSSHAERARYVKEETRKAFESEVPILPFFIEDVEPSERFKFLIGNVQWLRSPRSGWKKGLAALKTAIRERLDRVETSAEAASSTSPHAVTVEPAPIRSTPSVAPDPSEPRSKLVIAYKRGAQPDEEVLQLLEREFAGRGHQVFVDRHLRVGVEWAREIEVQVRQADVLIPLLSAASIQSEMLIYEVQTAHEEAQKREGKPRLLPVRIAYEGPLPSDLAGPLDRLHYFLWKGAEDNARLIAELADALRAPRPIKPPRPIPVGGMPLDSESYIKRSTDSAFFSALDRRDSIILIRGARQMGKTSLLARGLQRARESGAVVAFSDFQKLNRSELESPDAFYKALGAGIARELRIEVLPQDVWQSRQAPNTNFEEYLEDQVLEALEGKPLVWALDEVDRLFTCDFGSEVFGLFRSWHNDRAVNPRGPWGRLTMVIAYATEAHLFITDMNQSPFNVGTLIPLEDFTPEQAAELNVRYESPLREPERATFYGLVGGHPYLNNRGLFEMAENHLKLDQFTLRAMREEGLFGDHLRRILVLLAKDPALSDTVRGMLSTKDAAPPDGKSFYRLRAAGLLSGDFAGEARFRCRLYEDYLKRHLL